MKDTEYTHIKSVSCAEWLVKYDKPAYCEDFSAYYMFMTP